MLFFEDCCILSSVNIDKVPKLAFSGKICFEGPGKCISPFTTALAKLLSRTVSVFFGDSVSLTFFSLGSTIETVATPIFLSLAIISIIFELTLSYCRC